MVYPLIILALATFWFALKVRFIPVSIACAAFWFGLAAYLFLYMPVPLDPDLPSSQFTAAGLVLMGFIPLLLQFRTDIQTERRARDQSPGGNYGMEQAELKTTHKWNIGGKPKPTSSERQLAYKSQLQKRRK